MEATDVLRSLVKEIILTPDPDSGELQTEVRGDLAGILAISLERKKPSFGEGCAQFEMVAGTGFEHCSDITRLGGSGQAVASAASDDLYSRSAGDRPKSCLRS